MSSPAGGYELRRLDFDKPGTEVIAIRPDNPDGGYGSEHRSGSRLHDWRLKAAIQNVLSTVPKGASLNYLLQRYVTKTLPISDAELDAQVAKAQRNLRSFQHHRSLPLASAHLYEFGVGWDLLLPLVYYAMGVERQTVVDVRALARTDLMTDVARRLAQSATRLGLVRGPAVPAKSVGFEELAATWGIEYRAPADTRAVDLPDNSIDLVTSTDVLEHVPLDDIRSILRECCRLLRRDGLLRMRIDYQDHYWYFDSRLSPYNFLRFTERQWRLYNPSLHYQNRIRHLEFMALIAESGLKVIEDDHPVPSDQDLEALASTPLSRDYRSIAAESLAIRYANLTLGPLTAGS